MKATIPLILALIGISSAQRVVGPANFEKLLVNVKTGSQEGLNDRSYHASNENTGYNVQAKTDVDNTQTAQLEGPAPAPEYAQAPSYEPAPAYAPAPSYEPAPAYAPSYEPAPAYAPSHELTSAYAPSYEPAPAYLPGSYYIAGPNNWLKSRASINSGVQSAANRGSSHASNANNVYNIASKADLEETEDAQAEDY